MGEIEKREDQEAGRTPTLGNPKQANITEGMGRRDRSQQGRKGEEQTEGDGQRLGKGIWQFGKT